MAAAYRLSELRRTQQRPVAITVLEAADRFGGVIETTTRDGYLLEGGPDSFLSDPPVAVELCRRLGIADELIETQPHHRRSYVVRKGRLVPVPPGVYLIAPGRLTSLCWMPLLSWPGRLRMACEPFIPVRREDGDESVASFVRRRLGREALTRLGQPMIGGIYAADPERLSLQATFPTFRDMERRYGSLIRGIRARAAASGQAVSQASGPRYSLFLSLRGGLRTLIDALIAQMPDVELRRSAPVARMARGVTWTITLLGGETIEADAVCLALPAHHTATLLRFSAPDLAQALAGIPYESVATVNLAFRRADVPHPLDGFGVVMPSVERRGLMGCTFSSVKFPDRAPEGMVLLRGFVGGALQPEMFALDESAMERMVRDELRDLLGIRAAPRLSAIHRYRQAMPQYHLGHLERLAAIEETARHYPGLYLTGNGYRGIGIPDCIRQAEVVAEQMWKRGHSEFSLKIQNVPFSYDHILVIGFGGPTKPEEIRPFLEQVRRGSQIPQTRLQEVLRHYEAVGGRSRYHDDTVSFATKLEARLRAQGLAQPVLVGMRNWHPLLKDVLGEIQRRGFTRGLGLILAPHRCDVSFERYLRDVEEAKACASAQAVQYAYLPPWHDQPLFIEAQADVVRKTLEALGPEDRAATHLVFSAHSIPTAMAQRCRYAEEIESSSRALARRLGHEAWSVAYQSRSGDPREPWLGPDIAPVLRDLKGRGSRRVIVVPIGFLCENVEVLYDLDIEARQEAERVGLGFSRASTVLDQPTFVEMFVQLIQDPDHWGSWRDSKARMAASC